MKLKPLSDRVVIKMVEAEETTKSGIIGSYKIENTPEAQSALQNIEELLNLRLKTIFFHIKKKEYKKQRLTQQYGGRGEIRTPGCLATSPDFESGALDHSATLPFAD